MGSFWVTKILVYIPSKLSGGGRRQLQEVCDVLIRGGSTLSLASPGSCDFQLKGEIQYLQLSGCRLLVEAKLACMATYYDRVFCYSNLPALFVSFNKQIIFLRAQISRYAVLQVQRALLRACSLAKSLSTA